MNGIKQGIVSDGANDEMDGPGQEVSRSEALQISRLVLEQAEQERVDVSAQEAAQGQPSPTRRRILSGPEDDEVDEWIPRQPIRTYTADELLSRVESIARAVVGPGNTTAAAMLRELATRSREDYVAAIQAAGLHVGMDVLQRAIRNVQSELQEAGEVDAHQQAGKEKDAQKRADIAARLIVALHILERGYVRNGYKELASVGRKNLLDVAIGELNLCIEVLEREVS